MPVNLHLFSSSGDNGLQEIVEASRPYLHGEDESTVAYLPLASLYAERWLDFVEESFRGLARLETVSAELMSLAQIERILREASLAFIPGGNTFLLNHRLHLCGVMPYLRKKVASGLPLVAFSAGTVLCGPNILTAKDMNTVSTAHFDALGASPFNFLVHYDPALHDEWLSDYHFFHDNPVIMLRDGALLRSTGKKIWLECGEGWILRKGQEKQRLEPKESIAP